MNRRNLIRLAACAGLGGFAHQATAVAQTGKSAKGPIVLYCDLAVDPAREQEMLDNFHNTFKPAAVKFDGYIDLKMLKIRKVMSGGPLPAGINYRFQLTFESEEKRQIWIHSDVHKRVWPLVENTVLDKNYITLLTDSV